jgi:hypothetical protein
MSGKQSFTIRYSPQRLFNLIIDSFSFSAAWYQTLRINSARFIITSISTLLRIIQILSIKRIKFTIANSLVKLLQNLPMTLSIKRIKFTTVWKELYRLVQILSVKRIKFVGELRQRLRINVATLAIKKIKFVANVVVALFYTLSHWDPYYLSDLDAYTLEQMDYTV